MSGVEPRGVALEQVTASRRLESFDPVAAFRAISVDGQGFILDGRSPEPGAGRFVYVGSGTCERLVTGAGTAAGAVDPASALLTRLAARRIDRNGFEAPFASGAIGFFAYEAVRYFEPSVGDIPADPIGLPEAAFFLPDRFVVYDREERRLTSVVLVEVDADFRTKEQAQTVAAELLEKASREQLEIPTQHRSDGRYTDTFDLLSANGAAREHYVEMVQQAREEIERGELIQVVLSQRVIRRTDASPLQIYSALASLNPSPYMFMLNFGDFALVGSSPELMVRSRGDEVSMHPIAGTRRRGSTTEKDAALEAEMLTSEKERAEHVMLVDLARNDLGRVCKPGSVEVDSFMATERYSHVMHLVSRVKGTLRPDATGLDAFVAGFPLGTLTGAPRLRAVEMIAELEKEGRGPYCGGVGWFDASGDVDTGTVIRCIAVKDGAAHVQGGGGVVFDSDPEREYLESVHKMAAQFEAIEMAEEAARSVVAEPVDVAAG